MKSTDDIHNLTDHIYKNLVDNFTYGIRQILLTGKAYHKALQGIANTAHAYNDALRRVGSAAKIGKGGTEEIGEAILQIAETQKEIQSQIEESNKALFTELILPLEQKLEKEFKKSHADLRKYTQGHKAVIVPYNKAFDTLKKFRKKTKNKYVYDNEKEAQYMRSLGKCQEKLDEYRINGLRAALLEERRCHCFLLQRLCSVSNLNLGAHKNGVQLYSMLPDWLESCANPHRLPQGVERLLAHPIDEQYEPMNGGLHSNGFLHRDNRDTHSLGSPFRRSTSAHDLFRFSGHFDGTKTLPSRPGMQIPPPPSAAPQVQAVYTFAATVETQLGFNEGDILVLLGEKSEGWQYGLNTKTGRYGWFPLSFTQPVASGSNPDMKTMSAAQRVKSVNDLFENPDQPYYDQNIPGNIRRPKSMYEGPHHVNSVTQAICSPFPADFPSSQYAPGAYPPPLYDQEQIYQQVPIPFDDLQRQSMSRVEASHRQSGIYSARGRPVHHSKSFHESSLPSPPLPPPPPPPNYSSMHDNPQPQKLSGASMRLPAPPSHPVPKPPGVPPPAPPPPPPPPPVSTNSSQAPPPPPPPVPSANPSVSNVTSSQVTHGNGLPSASYGSPSRQQSRQPPPPPPPPFAGGKSAGNENYGIEEDVNFKENPMFSSVSLRRTKTNDRSAPKIN